ncbi:DUF4145 domain-containing protein [Streptomyces microflavus]|uniref:hypothetical protein n=1 Tax=Streptomyces microflavus TaxID=1919 RepID=UPI00367E684F
MDWKLLLEYIKVFAWPTVVLTLGLVFRKQLIGLARNIDSVDTPIGGVTFQRQAEAVAEEAAEIEGEIAAELGEPTRQAEPLSEQDVADAPARNQLPIKPVRFEREFASLLRVAQSDPTAAVLGAWRELEAALTDVIPPSNVRYTPAAMIRRAEMQGVLPGNLARVAGDLRILRNRVVHEGDMKLTPEGAASYVTATQSVIDALSLARTPQARAIRFEQAVFRALIELGFPVQPSDRDGELDFFVNVDDRKVGVIAKYRGREHFGSDLMRLSERFPPSAVPLLIVTNAPLSRSALKFNTEGGAPANTAIREVVQWRDGQDDTILAQALHRVAES